MDARRRPGIRMATSLAVLTTTGAVALGLWALMIQMPGRSFTGSAPPWSSQEQIMAAQLERDVRRLAQDIGERSVWRPAGLDAAAAHIEGVFRESGYTIDEQVYESFGVPVRNVEATRTGSRQPEQIILVGAHYDSVRGTVGANDNASGVAAMLEIARALSAEALPRTLRFVAFVNEEPPHFNVGEMGSQVYARAAAQRGDVIIAMLSLETIGYYDDTPGSQRYPFPFNLVYPDRGDFIGFVGNIASRRLLRRSVGIFRETTRFPSQGVAAPAWVPGVSWSDHGSFWPHGYPAIMVTDTALYRYPYYHTLDDQPERLDYLRMARVVAGLKQVVRRLAEQGV
jgi:hypothetical protein